jgi:tetratricopeptide (TPR) repeat protein
MLVADGDDPHLPWVIAVADLEVAEQAAALRTDLDLAEALKSVRDADDRGDWLGAARQAEALVDDPDIDDRERLTLLVLLLAAANHAADPVAGARWRQRLDTVVHVGAAGEDLARALGSRLVGAVDALDPVAADAAAALVQVEDFDAPLRVHLLGPLALLRTLQGRREEALELRRQALAAAAPDERPRCLGDLADALLRLGQPGPALDACDQALALVPVARRRHAYLARTAAYLGLHRARALAALRQRQEARAALAPALEVQGLDPALRARLLLAELDDSLAAVQVVADRLPPYTAANPLVRALLDRSRAALGDPAAAVRLRALPAFAGLDPAEVALRLPY